LGYALFIIYLVLFCWLVTKSRFIINAGLSSKIIIALFFIKVIAGCLNSWVFSKMGVSSGSDTLTFQEQGLIEYHLLFNNPGEYISNFFKTSYKTGYGDFFSSTNSYWNDLTGNIIIKFLSICDIFSFGNFYVNVIFYNYVTFFGAAGLYRVFNSIYPKQPYLLVCTCFLLPSLLFYSSNIHKEGLIYAALGIAVYNIYNALNTDAGFSFKKITIILAACIFIFLQRNYVLMAFIPAAFAWILCSVKKYPALLTFAVTYIIGAFIFFNAASISPKLNLPRAVSKKQLDFKQLGPATTYLPLDTLVPVFKSFVINAPQAINHSFLRPFVSDIKLSKALIPLAVELIFYELLLVLFIFFNNNNKPCNPFIVFGLFFSFSVLMIIGYTVPILGAIVRYRSIYLSFIVTPLACGINWEKVKTVLQIKK
jgi:hypothetical protein